MGQIISQDIISTPSHSSGTIILPPSLLTLGGRKYRTVPVVTLYSTSSGTGRVFQADGALYCQGDAGSRARNIYYYTAEAEL